MKPRFMTLKAWAQAQYGEDAPTMNTLRRWCRDLKIYPFPKKHGRTYFVLPTAQYVEDYNDSDFLRRLRGDDA